MTAAVLVVVGLIALFSSIEALSGENGDGGRWPATLLAALAIVGMVALLILKKAGMI